MIHRSFILAAVLASLAAPAWADTSPDFVFFDAQIAALQHRIDASTTITGVNPEALTAAQGKQQELVNQEAKLKAAGKMTPDEKTALGLSIRQQQQRLSALTGATMPAMKHVDPASLPAPTYVTPMGTTISGPVGTSPQQNGVVPLGGDAPVVQSAPQSVMPAPGVTTPTIAQPTVPVVHAPGPTTQQQ